MKSPIRTRSLFVLLTLIPCLSPGQTVTVSTWQNAKAGAVSLTFDDALGGHWSHADPIMATAGVRGTFFVITGSVDWDGARNAALNGHEIGSHSTIDATLQNDPNAAAKMQTSHDAIETEIGSAIPGYQCHTIAWPYGFRRLDVTNDPAYQGLYVSARNAGNALLAGNSYNAADTSQWWKYGEGDYGMDHFYVVGDALMTSGTTLSTFEQQLDNVVIANNGWTVFTYHGIETGGYQNIAATEFTAQVNALVARKDSLYIAPYGEVVRYIYQRDEAVAAVTVNDGTSITLSLTDTLDNSVFNIPLTLQFDAPGDWTEVTATQDGSPVEAWIAEGTVYVNAVPDAGEIVVTKSGGGSIVVPVLSIQPAEAGMVELSWQTSTGHQYEVLESSSLGGWQPMQPPATVVGDDSEHKMVTELSTNPHFFILDVTPAP